MHIVYTLFYYSSYCDMTVTIKLKLFVLVEILEVELFYCLNRNLHICSHFLLSNPKSCICYEEFRIGSRTVAAIENTEVLPLVFFMGICRF